MSLPCSNFIKAKNLPNCSWHVFQGLALSHLEKKQTDIACQDMEECIAHLREKSDMSPKERIEFVTNLIDAAKIHVDLGNLTNAIDKLQEAIRVDGHFYKTYYKLFILYNDSGRISDASKLLNDMMKKSIVKTELTHFEAMLLEYTKWMESIKSFELFLQACEKVNMLQIHFQALQQALSYAQDNNMQHNLISLLLAHGITLARYSANKCDIDLALSQWERCCDLVFNGGNHRGESTALSAARYIFNYNFTKIKTLDREDSEYIVCLRKMQDLARKARDSYSSYNPLNYSLAAVYSYLGNQDKGQALLLDEIKRGFDLLSDDDPSNDDDGYVRIGNVLAHSGDDLNAISAFSLIGPPERLKAIESSRPNNRDEVKCTDETKSPETGSPTEDQHQEPPFRFFCDGSCSAVLKWSDSLWFCKICDDIQFNDECMEKLHKGTLPLSVCSPDHEWLYVPSWTDEYRATGKGFVRTGGKLQDEKRVGGSIVQVAGWLDSIREKWGIEKTLPAPKVQNDT